MRETNQIDNTAAKEITTTTAKEKNDASKMK